jgi:hypothetical protein
MFEVAPEFEGGVEIGFPPLRLVNGGIDYEELEDWEREEYLAGMFLEASQMPFSGRHVQGPHFQDIKEILEKTDTILTDIHPKLVPEHLMPLDYQSRAARLSYRELQLRASEMNRLSMLRHARTDLLANLGAAKASEESGIVIPEGVLGVPPYYMQEYSGQACFRACFRMIFDGMTGSAPGELALGAALTEVHRDTLVHDEEFLKVFSSPTFQKLYPNVDAQVITITGANLDTIKTLAEGLQAKQPDRKVYCVVSLQTETAQNRSVWHTNVLLGADADTVITHDPSSKWAGKPFRTQSKENFYSRWAVAFNRAHLIIAA